jgi:hypothetical protein
VEDTEDTEDTDGVLLLRECPGLWMAGSIIEERETVKAHQKLLG